MRSIVKAKVIDWLNEYDIGQQMRKQQQEKHI